MKILIILLVIVIVLFVVFVVWGNSKNASSPNTNAVNFPQNQSSIVKAFDTMLGRFGPKLHLAVKRFDLSAKSPIEVIVPADPDHKFRTAKFHLTTVSQKGCASIEYKAPEDEGDFNPQKWPDNQHHPFATEVPPKEISFLILKSGGTITFTHAFPFLNPCVVETE